MVLVMEKARGTLVIHQESAVPGLTLWEVVPSYLPRTVAISSIPHRGAVHREPVYAVGA